jgi:glycosyltransferase involved in cell wall biosynthesis
MKIFRPLVSIVIPVYNGGNYLRESIDSALSQTYENIEVIVVNDGSTDGGDTEKIALSFGNRIRYFSKNNGGTSTALNLGISKMSGDYFCWLSHDDLYRPENIEIQIKTLASMDNKKTITMTELDCINSDYEVTIKSTDYKQHRDSWPKRNEFNLYPVIYMNLHGCQLMFHKSVFEEVGLFNEEILVAQDYEFFFRAFKKFPNILIPSVLGTARDSENRQGRRLKDLADKEYSRIFFEAVDSLSDTEIEFLSPSKIEFFRDMKFLWETMGYKEATHKLIKKMLPSLQINYTDLMGGGFNGFNLHLDLMKMGYESSQIVWHKESDVATVFGLSQILRNQEIFDYVCALEADFERKASFAPFGDDILNHPKFMEASVVHLNIIHHPFFNLNDLPLISNLKPTIWTIHDPWAVSGHCIHPADCLSWMKHCGDCPYLSSHFEIKHDNTALEFERKKIIVQTSNLNIVVANEWMKQKIKNSPIFEGKQITVIPFGVDQDVFYPKDSAKLREKFNIPDKGIVLFARIDVHDKGTRILIKAVNSLAISNNITLITVGQSAAITLGELSPKVNHIDFGWVYDRNDLADLFCVSDLFLMPSETESFGLMAVEAMSCRKVVVAIDSENSAVPSTINSPTCGIATSAENFASQVQYLIDMTEIREEHAERSLQYARNKYNSKTYTNRILELYRNVIQEFSETESSIYINHQIQKNSKSYKRITQKINVNYVNGYKSNHELFNMSVMYAKQYGIGKLFLKYVSKLKALYRRQGFKGLVQRIFVFIKVK